MERYDRDNKICAIMEVVDRMKKIIREKKSSKTIT
jgi:hypothetical protein